MQFFAVIIDLKNHKGGVIPMCQWHIIEISKKTIEIKISGASWWVRQNSYNDIYRPVYKETSFQEKCNASIPKK